MRLKTLLATLGIGAGLMYFMDPEHGNRRRAMVRDKANAVVNDLDEFLEKAQEDLRNRARGTLSEMTAKLSDQGAPDWILEERVRSNLGRLARHTGGVDVRADGGYIHLSGPVLREDRESIVKTASRTRGVYGVEDELRVSDNPQDIPALQGQPSQYREVKPDWQQAHWSPATRLLSGVGGSLLTMYGLRRRGLTKPLLSTAGLILTTRSITNMDTRSMLGMGLGENAIRVRKAINIDAPIDEVYQFWRNFDNFKLFMEHVKEINTEGDISTWKVAGPAGATVEFQSKVTREVPNEVIAWETLPDSQVHSSGFVRFDPNNMGGTRVSVQMDYVPPAGALGHAVAQLFGVDPRQAMHEDLLRLKSLLEEGKTSSSEGEVELETDESLD